MAIPLAGKDDGSVISIGIGHSQQEKPSMALVKNDESLVPGNVVEPVGPGRAAGIECDLVKAQLEEGIAKAQGQCLFRHARTGGVPVGAAMVERSGEQGIRLQAVMGLEIGVGKRRGINSQIRQAGADGWVDQETRQDGIKMQLVAFDMPIQGRV